MPRTLPEQDSHWRWRRFWGAWVASVLLSGIGIDTVAYVRYGWQATLTASIRRWSGLEPRTPRGRLGQAILVGFFSWLGVHLSFGILGPVRGRPADCGLFVPTIVDPPARRLARQDIMPV